MDQAPLVRSRPMLSYLLDPANAMTMAGLCCAGTSIFLSALGNHSGAVLAMVWAAAFDWFDGAVGRAHPGRSAETKAMGGQLDSLADIVSGAVCPTALLYSAAGHRPWSLVPALLLLVAGATRLAYFNVFGSASGGGYVGLTIDKNIVAVACVALVEPWLTPSAFARILGVTLVLLAAANVAPFRSPKLAGRWYYAYALTWVVFTIVFGHRWWSQARG